MEIRKWEVWLADLNPGSGTEPGKIRPVIVIQTNLLNDGEHPSTLICPITTKVLEKAKWLRVHLEPHEGGLKERSDILVDQIRAIDNRRFRKKSGEIYRQNRFHLVESLGVILDI